MRFAFILHPLSGIFTENVSFEMRDIQNQFSLSATIWVNFLFYLKRIVQIFFKNIHIYSPRMLKEIGIWDLRWNNIRSLLDIEMTGYSILYRIVRFGNRCYFPSQKIATHFRIFHHCISFTYLELILLV